MRLAILQNVATADGLGEVFLLAWAPSISYGSVKRNGRYGARQALDLAMMLTCPYTPGARQGNRRSKM